LERTGLPSINWNEIFKYGEGKLYWKISPAYNVKVGKSAGNKTGAGYWQVCYKGKFYKLHRVIWEMHNGPIPDNLEIDHIDRNAENNLISNLRLASRVRNAYNRNVMSNNKLGVKGVSVSGKKFVAYINVNRKTVNLGYYDSVEEASAAYQIALKYLEESVALLTIEWSLQLQLRR